MSEEVHETPSATPNFQTELAVQLAELMPEVIADGKVEVEKLKQLLDGDATDSSERFGLFWPGKKRALRAAQEPTTATLRPDFDNSKDWDNTKNVFIEGDNLEVLKILQKHYHAKVKMIYIDPPYNTGKDFVYPDNFTEGLDTYLEWTRQVNEEGKKLSTNADTEGRYHSNWLNMMYPRLKLARNLLAEDGAIFVSIDDNEVESLVRVMKEIFGESNHLANLAWEKVHTRKNSSKYFSGQHEYVIAFAKRKDKWDRHLLPRDGAAAEAYKNPDNDPKGAWKLDPITAHNYYSANYKIVKPNGTILQRPKDRYWVFSEETWNSKVAEGAVIWGAGASLPMVKRYLSEVQSGLVPVTLLTREVAGDTATAKREVDGLLGAGVFTDYPKPTKLIRQLLLTTASSNDLVLDFFAGSGTTAHAVMALNAEDGGSRRVIQVQLPEPIAEGTEAWSAGFRTISDISRARMSSVETVLGTDNGAPNTDFGYRSYRLTDTNFSKWRVSSDVSRNQLEQHLFDLSESSVAYDASADDMLSEILLKQGYSLTEHLTPVEVGGLNLHSVGDGIVLTYLNAHIKPSLEQLRAVVEVDPQRLIFLEDAFQGDDQLKTNLSQLCKSQGIELWTA